MHCRMLFQDIHNYVSLTNVKIIKACDFIGYIRINNQKMCIFAIITRMLTDNAHARTHTRMHFILYYI